MVPFYDWKHLKEYISLPSKCLNCDLIICFTEKDQVSLPLLSYLSIWKWNKLCQKNQLLILWAIKPGFMLQSTLNSVNFI